VLAKILKENGYRVELVTMGKIDWTAIQRIIGIGKEVVDRETVIARFIRLPFGYGLFAYWLLRDAIIVPLMRRKLDLSITVFPTLPVVFTDILYVHFPSFIPSYIERFYPKYSHNGWLAYSLPYRLLLKLFIKAFNSLKNKPVVLTNSVFSQRAIEDYLDVKANVVYPPVDTKKYSHGCSGNRRGNIVLTISRFVEDKNLSELLAVARDAPEASFVVLGTAAAKSDYVERLRSEAKKMGINDRISLIINGGENQKTKLFSQAKIYLHTMRYEHFGISIVEAMSAGLVPVVHRSGGPWLDILNETEGKVGYSYSSNHEAAAIISQLLKNENKRKYLSKKAIERAKAFDFSHFESSMMNIVADVLAKKQTNSYS
jgi:glycosyltransferase involved in cell wall biosynthesis